MLAYLPATQGTQEAEEVAPVGLEYEPTAHVVHAEGRVAPTKAEYVPELQLVQAVEPDSDAKEPAMHFTHTVGDACPDSEL